MISFVEAIFSVFFSCIVWSLKYTKTKNWCKFEEQNNDRNCKLSQIWYSCNLLILKSKRDCHDPNAWRLLIIRIVILWVYLTCNCCRMFFEKNYHGNQIWSPNHFLNLPSSHIRVRNVIIVSVSCVSML